MEGTDNYRVSKLKGSQNYESWKEDMTSALQAKGLWMITSGSLEKPEAPESNSSTSTESTSAVDAPASTAAIKEYAIAAHYWADKNDRARGMITYHCETGPRVHIFKITEATNMWFILETQYGQSDLTTLYLAIKELNRAKQSDFKSIQDYADSLKRVATRCSNVGKTIESWMLSNLFLLGLNESLEPYIFGLIQSAKANNFELLIDEMAIVLADHDKRSNEEEDFSFKSMVAQFGGKKRKIGGKLRKGSNKTCIHCEQTDEWKLSERIKDLAVDFETDFGVKMVKSMRISLVGRASSCINAWWIDFEADDHVCYDKNLFDEQTY